MTTHETPISAPWIHENIQGDDNPIYYGTPINRDDAGYLHWIANRATVEALIEDHNHCADRTEVWYELALSEIDNLEVYMRDPATNYPTLVAQSTPTGAGDYEIGFGYPWQIAK